MPCLNFSHSIGSVRNYTLPCPWDSMSSWWQLAGAWLAQLVEHETKIVGSSLILGDLLTVFFSVCYFSKPTVRQTTTTATVRVSSTGA